MFCVRLAVAGATVALTLACGGSTPPAPAKQGRQVDPSTAATITATVTFDGETPKPEMIKLDSDPKCVAQNGAAERPAEDIVLGDGKSLQNVFVYVKTGLGSDYTFPASNEPVVLDQSKCRYAPRVLGVRTGQPLAIRNSDPLLHNVRADGQFNRPFNMGHPIQGTSFNRTFTTSEVMVPFRCDVHSWMRAWVGVLDHPFFGVTSANGRVTLDGLPPGTYTVEAWHEKLGSKTQQVTVGAKDSKDVVFTFAR